MSPSAPCSRKKTVLFSSFAARPRSTTVLTFLYADSVDYDSDTGASIADGHVVLDGGPNDEHVEATHGTYNVRSEFGRFEHVVGTPACICVESGWS